MPQPAFASRLHMKEINSSIDMRRAQRHSCSLKYKQPSTTPRKYRRMENDQYWYSSRSLNHTVIGALKCTGTLTEKGTRQVPPLPFSPVHIYFLRKRNWWQ